MKKLTLPELQTALIERGGAKFVTFTARTDARLKKTDNPFGKVFKTSRVNGVINWSYGRAVNRQRGREWDGTPDERPDRFQPYPRKWGQRLPNLPFVQYKGRVYLEVKVQRAETLGYTDEAGDPLLPEMITPFLPKVSSNADHQEVDREVVLRDYDLANIVEIAFDGATYTVDTTVPAVPMEGVEV